MKRILPILVLLLSFGFNVFVSSVFAGSCDTSDCSNPEECQRKIEECQSVITAYQPAQSKNKEQLLTLQTQLNNTEKLIKSAESQLKTIASQIFDREVDLEYQRQVFNARVRNYYIRSRRFSAFLLMLSSDNAAQLTRELTYRMTMANEDKRVIAKIATDLTQLSVDKEKLEKNKTWLAAAKEDLAGKTSFLAGEVKKVEDYLGEVSGKIASLTSKQQSLLAEKTGTFQTTVGDVPLADDPSSRPDFNPGFSPAFAGFSFGAPHRKGLSQYGAFGRSKGGQNYRDILTAYYGNVEVRKVGMPGEINTSAGRMSFEGRYLRGIAEMPTVWADQGGYEALKAQAVAARSYALAYVGWRIASPNAGGSICVTESCQVFSSSKADNPGRWASAVSETEGEILVSKTSNEIVNAFYASTAGGYIYSYTSLGHSTSGFWDTTSSVDRWADGAWEVKGGSPWFYKGWYKSRSGASCGRSHPWLNSEEMADILNAIIVYRSGQGADRILPVDYNSCFGGGGNPFSKEEMKSQAGGAAINSVNGVSVTYGTNGVTNKLVFGTDRGSFEVGGEEFNTVFNLRAPGRISLKSKLFNLEKK